jgi:type I restriction enzyme S subunit
MSTIAQKIISRRTGVSEDSDLPEGWSDTTLDQILESLESGSRPKGGVRGISEGVPSIGGEHLNEIGGFRFDAVKYVPRKFFERMGRGHIKKGDILIVKDGATTGKVALVRDDFPYVTAVVNEHVFVCRLLDGLYPPFFFYFLFSKEGQDRILENFRGSAQGGINQSFAPGTAIPLAPQSEQKRIAAKVEELLTQVNALRARLAKVPRILKRFRQAVLAAACSGRLTEDWRSMNPATDTIATTIDAIRRRREFDATSVAQKGKIRQIYEKSEENDSSELPESWGFVCLNKLCSSFDYGTSAKSQRSGKVPVLRMGNIQSGKIDWTDLAYTSDREEIRQYSLQPNTVLFNRTNSPELVGKTAIYTGERPAIFAGYLIRISHLPELDPRYLNFCLNTNYARQFCSQVKTDGVSQSNINAQKLGMFEVPFCPLVEQHEIVRRVEALFNLADTIEKRVEAATKRAEKLTQAILAKAFRGELVPTEAELARREGRDYEPASVLLERIRAARQAKEVTASVNGRPRARKKTRK